MPEKKNLSSYILGVLLQDIDNDSEFAKYFNKELLQSEMLRSNILIAMFSFFIIGIFIPPFFGIKIPWAESSSHLVYFLFFLFYAGLVLYEVFVRILIKKAIKYGKRVSNKIRYGNAFEEVSIPTIGIIILSTVLDPMEVLLGPTCFIYFVFITIGALRLDVKLSIFNGLVASVEYLLVTLYYLNKFDLTVNLSIYMEGSVYPKAFILLLTGLITGVVTFEIRRRIKHSFKSMEKYNQELEQKVKERTYELESLNQGLKEKVGAEVKKSRESEQLLVQQSKMSAMGEMIGMIAHQWRQPLSSIGVVAGNLQVQYELDLLNKEFFDQSIQDINDQTRYLSTTITDFRRFLSPTKQKEFINFDEVVETALKIIGKSLENKNIQLKKTYEFNRQIETFPNELVQVVINILKNAQDVCLEREINSPVIELKGWENEHHLSFIINDNAGGIPEEILESVFNPYFTTKASSDGTGLGLYMSKTIIEKHCNGKLSAKNEKTGASFQIELPYAGVAV
jgi:signal transduction histidine kinase